MRYFLVLFILVSFQGVSQVALAIEENEAVNLLSKSLNLDEISSDYVAVNIWSPFCEPCGKEVGELNLLIKSQNLKSNKVAVVGIPVDGRKKEADEFISYFKPQYKILFLSTDLKNKFLKIGKIPFTILFNKKRVPIQSWVGAIRADSLMAAILKNEKQEEK